MQNEYELLSYLHKNELTSQRKIASRTGLSLGAVNMLLKKMVRKGLVKIERLDARKVRYILTPSGLKEKASLTYNYIRRSYNQIVQIRDAVTGFIENRGPFEEIILYGPPDEIREVLMGFIDELVPKVTIMEQYNIPVVENTGTLVLTWRNTEEKTLGSYGKMVNIMNII